MTINLQLASSSQVSPRCRVYAKQAAAICEDAYEATRAVYQAQTLVSAEEVVIDNVVRLRCPLCRQDGKCKTYARMEAYKKHLRTHETTSILRCPVEGCVDSRTHRRYENAQMAALEAHVCLKHTHEKPIKCPVEDCHEWFSASWQLHAHKKHHTEINRARSRDSLVRRPHSTSVIDGHTSESETSHDSPRSAETSLPSLQEAGLEELRRLPLPAYNSRFHPCGL